MSKTLKINDIEVSEETAALALREYFGKHPKEKKTERFGPKNVSRTLIGVSAGGSILLSLRDIPEGWDDYINYMHGKYDVLCILEAEELRDILQEAIDFAENL